MFKNMKIGALLSVGFAVMIALMVLLTMMSQDNMTEIQDNLDQIVKINVVSFDLANDLMDEVQGVAIFVRNMLLDDDLKKRQADKDMIPVFRDKYDESF